MLITPIIVGREEQEIIIDKAMHISGSKQHSQVIEFYGVAGIGKSRVLDVVKKKCRNDDIPFIGIDFLIVDIFESICRSKRLDSSRLKLEILQRFCDQLDHHVDVSHIPGIAEAHSRIAHVLQQLESRNKADITKSMDTICSVIAHSLQNRLIVFVFDTFDRCPNDISKWLWDSVLVYFEEAEKNRSIVVFVAGRQRIFAHDQKSSHQKLVTPRTVKSYLLDPLVVDATEAQTAALSPIRAYAKDAKEIHQISKGHPYSTETLVEWLGNHDIELVSSERTRMATEIYQKVITQYILAGVTEPELTLIRLACVPRYFDAGMLQFLATHFYPGTFLEKQIQWYQTVLMQLRGSPSFSVIFGEHNPAYELDPMLRKLLHTALATTSPSDIKAIHNKVVDLIEEDIRSTSAESVPTAERTLELLYHKSQVAKLDGGEVNPIITDTLIGILQAYYPERARKRIAELLTLKVRISEDRELEEVISRATLKKLYQLVTQTINPPTASNQSLTVINLDIGYRAPNEYTVSLVLPGSQSLVPTGVVASGLQFSLDDWRKDTEKTGKLAFRLFLPEKVQETLRTENSWHLQLTTNAPDVPWELLHDGAQYLSLKWPVARRANLNRAPKHQTKMNEGSLRALVIGDPTDDLPGSAQEARKVTEKLRLNRIEVDLLVGSSEVNSDIFIRQLHENAYDLIHYAGHAYFDPENPRGSGLHFANSVVLAEELERVMESSAFVFLSACEASASKTQLVIHGCRGNMVDGLAISVLITGCVACLGPMWPINDAYAVDFALAFYEHLLSSDDVTFGKAVQQARLKLQNSPREFWSAWTLYGDSHARLREAT